jgi:RNA polymerase sigma factor (sigma-70 family)
VWRVYGFLGYRLRDAEAVEDLTQATFERALRAWPRFDPRRGKEITWLLTIARNLLIDHHRREATAVQAPIEERQLPSAEGPEGRFVAGPDLAEALNVLDDREREILTLRFGGDLTGPEIAEVLDLTLANVQQITSRALRKLRAVLEEAGGLGGRRAQV